MNFVYNFLQLVGWVGVGYYIHAHNNWAIFGCAMFSMAMGFLNAMDTIWKQMGKHGNSSK